MFEKDFGHPCTEGDSITCTVAGFDCTGTVYNDEDVTPPDERQDGFWPSSDPESAGYVLPENFETEQTKAQIIMSSWLKDDWWYVGVAVTVSKAGIQLTGKYDHTLWGVDCNHPFGDRNECLRDVANELLPEALEDAREKLSKLCE